MINNNLIGMRQSFTLFLTMVFSIQLFSQSIRPPAAMRKDSLKALHGDTTNDPYSWMHDKHNSDFINYLYAENTYSDRVMKDTWLLQKMIYEEQKARIKEVDSTRPTKRDGYWYYSRYEKGKDFALLCRKKDSLTAREQVYFNGNAFAEKYSYFSLSTLSISPNHGLLAYGINFTGGDKGYLFIKNIDADSLLTDEIVDVADFVWVNDSVFLYSTEDKKSKRADKVYRHTLGRKVADDTLIWEEKSKGMFLSLGKTNSKKYVFLNRGSLDANESYFFDVENPYGEFELVQKLIPETHYSFSHFDDEGDFYVYTNYRAKNGRYMKCPVNNTSVENWTDVIKLPDSTMLKTVFNYRNYLVYEETARGLSEIKILDKEADTVSTIGIDGDSYVLGLARHYDYDSLKFSYQYTSLIQPAIEREYHFITKKDTVLEVDTVKNYNIHEFETGRIWTTANDGAKIPIDIVHKKNLERDSTNPLLLYAYASYGNNILPYFNRGNLVFLDRGFIYAIAHVRGESFLGKEWHEQGKRLTKKNTYTDFISCAQMLIDSGYTSKNKLAINGGSAGGMLMGAVTTMRPDLFKCVVADVPFIDVLNQMQDTAWSNIIGHYPEIGNPQIKEDYFYMKEWCPYQNISDTNYPDMLVTSGYNDSRVPVWSPAKWTAKLRAHKTDTNLLLLKTNMDAGHGGASGRYSFMKERATVLAFILKSLGIKENYITVNGKVFDENGEILPFVSVYLKGTTIGTTSNYEGEFSLDLREGTSQTIVFQYMGFKQKEITVDIDTETENLRVVLESEALLLSQVIVTADGKDPAYAIIKNAQKNRKKHLNAVESYAVDIYIKGIGRLNEVPDKLPAFFPKDQLPDSNDIGLFSLSESVAKYHYRKPDSYKEEMTASKISGITKGYSWNRANDVLMNFYENIIPLGWFSERGFISPIASSAMLYYKYELVDVLNEYGRTIYKIKLIPRRKNDPVFRGNIYIADGNWNYYGLDLILTKDAQIKWIDSLEIKQNHVPVNDSLWMPLSIQLSQHIKFFGFGAVVDNVGFFSNYRINRDFGPSFFNNEVFKIEKGANKKDSVYWSESRPVLLTHEEATNYHHEDSLETVRNSPVYKDSLNKAANKFKIGKLFLGGYGYNNIKRNFDFSISSLTSSIYFNTVEGGVIYFDPAFKFYLSDEENRWNRKYLRVKTNLKYSFTSDKFYGDVAISARTNNFKKQWFTARGGRAVQNYASIGNFMNMAYSLLLKENYAKFYQKDFMSVGASRETKNGMTGWLNLTYENRLPLTNVSDFTFIHYPDKEYTSNNPLDPDDDSPSFKKHDIFIANFSVRIKFRQKYETHPTYKRILPSKYPTVYFNYKKGIYLSNSNPGFDYVSVAVSDKLNFGMFGKSVYTVKAGGFIGKNDMEFIDYKHFTGNRTILLKSSWGVSQRVPFNTLNYFDYSTNEAFLAGRIEHHFNGWVFNKLPLLRKLKFQTLAGAAMLSTTDKGSFVEMYVGIENILNVLRIDFVTNYQNQKINPMLRVGVDIGF